MGMGWGEKDWNGLRGAWEAMEVHNDRQNTRQDGHTEDSISPQQW